MRRLPLLQMVLLCSLFSSCYISQRDWNDYYSQKLLYKDISYDYQVTYIKFGDGTMKINSCGSGFSGYKKDQDLTFLAAAEICYENGYNHFKILTDKKYLNITLENTRDVVVNRTDECTDVISSGYTLIIQCTQDSVVNNSREDIELIIEVESTIKSVAESYNRMRYMNARYPEFK